MPTRGMNSREDPNVELQKLQMRADQVTDESLESTRRMLVLCEESHDVGVKTIGMLDEQGEKLDHIESDMDEIAGNMQKAEKNLSEMEKCCGLCVLPCGKGTSYKAGNHSWKAREGEECVVENQPARIVPSRSRGPSLAPQGGYICKVNNDAREDEMEENMAQVSNMVGTLRNMALDMESELDHQNQQLSRIEYNVQSNIERIGNVTQRADVLMK